MRSVFKEAIWPYMVLLSLVALARAADLLANDSPFLLIVLVLVLAAFFGKKKTDI
jgi:hypothetical protein